MLAERPALRSAVAGSAREAAEAGAIPKRNTGCDREKKGEAQNRERGSRLNRDVRRTTEGEPK